MGTRDTVAQREMAIQQVFEDYWLRYVASLHCTMCGNCGIIDSRGVSTAAGVVVGRLNWCICPNGQARRRKTKQTVPTLEQFELYSRKVGGALAALHRELGAKHGK